jgi:hypothetical protein
MRGAQLFVLLCALDWYTLAGQLISRGHYIFQNELAARAWGEGQMLDNPGRRYEPRCLIEA